MKLALMAAGSGILVSFMFIGLGAFLSWLGI